VFSWVGGIGNMKGRNDSSETLGKKPPPGIV